MLLRLLTFFCAAVLVGVASAAPGDLETGFNPGLNGQAVAVVAQPDGRVLIGGGFTTVGGVSFPYIGRTSPAGVSEAGFRPAGNDDVQSIAVLPNGQLLLAGFFTTMGGTGRGRIARVMADGTLDTAFTASANDDVRNLELQSDGRILAGGIFTVMNGISRSRFARLLPDGTLDAAFNPAPNDAVRVSVVQPDGRILLGGAFTTVAGVPRSFVARLSASGAVDPDFDAAVTGRGVYAMVLQPDGKIVIGGDFTAVRGIPRAGIARLHADGTLEAGFNPGANNIVRSFALQTDGSIVAGGTFTAFGGFPRNRIARVSSDGILHPGFNPDANAVVYSVMLQADGKVLTGGEFTMLGGITRNRVARLDNDTAGQALTVLSPARIQWLRSGASPETNRVTFELSAGGGTWTVLGAGSRTAGGWELPGQSLPAAGQVRARARVNGSYGNGSTSLVETVSAYSFSALQMWRHANFGTVSGAGSAADNADPDRDGLENLVEFAFGRNPGVPDAADLPRWELSDDDYVLSFSRPAGVEGITYRAEYSTSLALDSWTPATVAGTPAQPVFYAPATSHRLYLRTRVTAP